MSPQPPRLGSRSPTTRGGRDPLDHHVHNGRRGDLFPALRPAPDLHRGWQARTVRRYDGRLPLAAGDRDGVGRLAPDTELMATGARHLPEIEGQPDPIAVRPAGLDGEIEGAEHQPRGSGPMRRRGRHGRRPSVGSIPPLGRQELLDVHALPLVIGQPGQGVDERTGKELPGDTLPLKRGQVVEDRQGRLAINGLPGRPGTIRPAAPVAPG